MNTAIDPLGLITPTDYCPNEPRSPGVTIAIVGEAPGREEVAQQQPFVGGSGRLMWAILGNAGITRLHCGIYNVSQFRPPGNDISEFKWSGVEIQEGLKVTTAQLLAQKPNIVLVLGNAALCAARGGTPDAKGNWPWAISSWTGSLFWSPVWNCKCLACVHPSSILRQYVWLIYLRVAARRLKDESSSPELKLPDFRFRTEPSFEACIIDLHELETHPRPITLDIEGGIGTMSCIGFAGDDSTAFIIPFTRADGTSLWSIEQECEIWRALQRVMCNPNIPKILQNYLYDSMVNAYHYGLPILGLAHDTMLQHWEVLSEFEKALDVQASLYTRIPYWKDGRSTTGNTLWEYCCTDCVATRSINTHLNSVLAQRPDAQRHYKFNVELLPAFLYMQMRGMAYDSKEAARLLALLDNEIYERQHECNCMVITKWPTTSGEAVLLAADACCFKRFVYNTADDLVYHPKKDFEFEIHHIADIAKRWPDVTNVEKGYFATQLGLGINVDSSPQMAQLLYEVWKLPKQFKKVKGRVTAKVTTDQLALLDLYVETKDERVLKLLRLRGKIDQRKQMKIATDKDGRVRSSFNIVGTETGRINSYTSITGSGTNLTTIPKEYRKLYVAG